MSRQHRDGIEMEDPSTEIRVGQVWRHRWKGNESTIVERYPLSDTALVRGVKRESVIRSEILLRDYRLVG